jgi:predicted alpha/beta superfamily hydrolase
MPARLLVLLFVALVGCSPPPAPAADAGPTVTLTPDSGQPDAGLPDAGADTAVLRVHYPAGSRTLSVRGSGAGLSWTEGVAMTAGPDDVWTLVLSGLTAPIEWKPLLDDQVWARGPNSHLAPGQTLDVFPHFTATSGTVTKQFPAFASTTLGNTRDVWVYLPPVYLENTRARLPVLYMHDGQNLFDPSLASFGTEWGVDEAFDAAAESGTCDAAPAQSCQNDSECPTGACRTFAPAIVVGVGNTSARIDEYTPTHDASFGAGGKGDLYLQMLATELKPQVDQALRTRPGRDGTLILGSSLGALISAHAGLAQPNVWGRVGAMSPSSWWDEKYIVGAVNASAGQEPRPARVYVDSGDSGASQDGLPDTQQLAQAYQAVGYTSGENFLFIVGAGDQHNEAAWAKRFPGAMRFLLGDRP